MNPLGRTRTMARYKWPGQSLAVPFYPTPDSRDDDCNLVTKVNVLGKVETSEGFFQMRAFQPWASWQE
jgi:hypothetical protein